MYRKLQTLSAMRYVFLIFDLAEIFSILLLDSVYRNSGRHSPKFKHEIFPIQTTATLMYIWEVVVSVVRSVQKMFHSYLVYKTFPFFHDISDENIYTVIEKLWYTVQARFSRVIKNWIFANFLCKYILNILFIVSTLIIKTVDTNIKQID